MDVKKMRTLADSAPHGGSSRWLRLEPGQFVSIVLVGDPEARVIVWEDGKSRPAEREDAKHPGEAKTRVLQQVYLPETRSRMIWETNLIMWRAADRLRSKLPRWSLALTRTGSGMQTRYDVTPDAELDAATLAAIPASPSLEPLLAPGDTSAELWEGWLAASKAPAPSAAQPADLPPDDEIPF